MKNSKDNLGNRMKQYESCFRVNLPKRMPVICRLDGKAFHTYTAPLKQHGKPNDIVFEKVMNYTALELCRQIQGVQIAYVQSDEISLLLHNYKKLTSQAWFDNEIQKMVSVSASIAGATFTAKSWEIWADESSKETKSFKDCFDLIKPAYFDSRVFILPEAEVCNYFIWRQKDVIRNSVQQFARAYFSHNDCKKFYKKSRIYQ